MKKEFTYADAEKLRFNKMLFEALTDEEQEDVRIIWDMMDTEQMLIDRDFQSAPDYYEIYSDRY